MKYLAFILLFTLSTNLFSQQTDENTLIINEYFKGANAQPVANKSSQPNDKISAQSFVSLIQTGNENSIYINALQTGDNQNITQNGDKNNYEYYNYYSGEKSNLKVNQVGTLNSLQIFGENSLMKDAVINQKSNFKSLVIKNYTN